MKRFLFLLGLAATPALGQGNPVSIPIQNPSFESPLTLHDSNPCGLSTWQGIPGWTFIQLPNTSYGVIRWTCSTPPDGQNVVYTDGTIIVQDTGVKPSDLQANTGPQRDGLYTMTFFVADYWAPYPGYWEAKVLVGPSIKPGQDLQQWFRTLHEMCSLDGPATQAWKQVTFPCSSPGYLIYDGWPPPWANPTVLSSPDDHLIISLSASGWRLVFDNVSLTFSAE